MPPQTADWTCSACALAWVLRSTAVDTSVDEWRAVELIGYPENINETYGLMDARGTALAHVLEEVYGIETKLIVPTFDQLYSVAGNYIALQGGGSWYHWSALRGRQSASLWIANSAPGYKGVYDELDRYEYQALGPFQAVVLTHFK